MQSRFFLDVVIRQSATILQLLASENQTLLIRGNAFFVLNFGFHILDGIAGLYFQGDGLAGQSLDEDLHTSPQSEDQVKGRLLLDVVIGQSPAVLQLLTGEDQPLLVWGNSLLVLKQINIKIIRLTRANILSEYLNKFISRSEPKIEKITSS